MRVAAVFAVLCLVAAAASPVDPAHATAEFERFIARFDKEYASGAEASARFEAFTLNLQMIEAHNANPLSTFALEVNEFADMLPEEFRQQRLMSPRAPVSHATERFADSLAGSVDLPAAFDWRNASSPVVTAVRDQGSTGTCWAFSTAQNIEGQWALAGHALEELSVEQIVDCDAEFDPNNTNADCGVFGGWPYLSYQYVIKAGGLESEAEYPYCCGTGDCYPCMAQGYNSSCGPPPSYCNATENRCSGLNMAASITSWLAVSSDEAEIAAQLYAKGPLSVLLNASWLQFYSSGVFNPSSCDPTELDHAVLLVGWGVDGDTPYWSVKNSWGQSWGEAGYFRIVRGKGTCGINTAVTTSVV